MFPNPEGVEPIKIKRLYTFNPFRVMIKNWFNNLRILRRLFIFKPFGLIARPSALFFIP